MGLAHKELLYQVCSTFTVTFKCCVVAANHLVSCNKTTCYTHKRSASEAGLQRMYADILHIPVEVCWNIL